MPGSSTAKSIGKSIGEQITGQPAPPRKTASESIEELTGAKLPSIPDIELPRPFEYQTDKYKTDGTTGEDVGATAIDLLLLKRGISGKPNATPESLKTLGGIPEAASTAKTASTVAKTESVVETVPKPIWKSRPSTTIPSSKKPLEAIGTPEKPIANPKAAPQKEFARGIQRQNEAAEVMSKNGYFVEHQPKIDARQRMHRYPWLDPKKKPDFKIEGEIFDGYSPSRNTSITNIIKVIEKKNVTGQARRILLNLDDSKVSLFELQQELQLSKLQFLDEVVAVKNGKIVKLYPN